MFNKLSQKLNKILAFIRRIILQRKIIAVFRPLNFLQKIWKKALGKIRFLLQGLISFLKKPASFLKGLILRKKTPDTAESAGQLKQKPKIKAPALKKQLSRKIKLAKKFKGERAVPRNASKLPDPPFPKKIPQIIWRILRDINHGKHIPIYALIASIIFGVVFGAGLFLGFPKQAAAASVTYNAHWDASIDGWAWHLLQCTGTICDQGFTATDGNPAGSIYQKVVNKNRVNKGYMYKTITWEQMGVPAGATVTAVDGRFDVKVQQETYPAAHYIGLKIYDPAFAGTVIEDDALIEPYFDPQLTTWVTRDVAGAKNVLPAFQSSSSQIAIAVDAAVNSGNSGNATTEIHEDNVTFVVSYIPPANTISVNSEGTQAPTIALPSTNSNLGGAFTFTRSTDWATVSQITITDTGTVNANANLSNVILFYKQEAACSTSIPGDAVQFNSVPASFNASEKAVVGGGSMNVGLNKICLYVRFDVGSGASEDQTIDIEISNPSVDVFVSSGTVEPAVPVAISGATLVKTSLVVGGAGTQAASLPIPSANNNLGGAFTFARSASSTSVTQLTLTEAGTVNANTNLSNVVLFYKEETACSAFIPAGATQFNSVPASFDVNDKVTASGTMAVGASQVCLYVRFDVGSGAGFNETVDIEITDPSVDVAVSSGGVVPSVPVAIAGATTLVQPIMTVGAEGTQTASATASDSNIYIGGAFTFIRDFGSTNVSWITITDTGTVNANANLSNVVLFYKQESTCSASIPGDAVQFNPTPVNFNASEKTTATGTMPVGTSKVCLYMQLDVGSGAVDGNTVDVEISNPSVDVVAGGGAISPAAPIAIAGITSIVQPVITVGAEGTQVASIVVPAVDVNLGGAFTFTRSASSTPVTQLTLTETGTVNANLNLSNVILFYKEEATCSVSIPGDAVQFNSSPSTFNSSEKAVISGSMPVGASKVCLYVRLNAGSESENDATVDIEISNPSVDVVVGGGAMSPAVPVAIAGSSIINQASITAGAEGTQTASIIVPAAGAYLGGAFSFIRDNGSADITQLTLTEAGTVNANLNLSNVILFYKQEETCSASIPVGAVQFNPSPTSFNISEKAVIDGTMPVGTSKVCLYAQLDVGSGAADGNTIDIEISNPSTDVVVSSGRVIPATAVAISGATTLSVPYITVGAEGTQTPDVLVFSENNQLGGAFTFLRSASSTPVTQLTLTETGTVNANANLSNVILFYKEEAECSVSIPGDAVQFNPSPTSFNSSEKTTATGTMTVATDKICLYMKFDVGSGAAGAETIDVEISNPSTDIIASSGNVLPVAVVAISGSTALVMPQINVSSEGTQISDLPIPSADTYIGGAFTLTRSASSTSVTQLTLTEAGTVNADINLSNVILFYKEEAACGTSTPIDAVQFNPSPASFNASEKASATGTMTVATDKICLYVQLDIGSGAVDGRSLDIEISNPSTDVVASFGTVSPVVSVALLGSTTLNASIAVSSEGTQISDYAIPSANKYIGGAFAFARSAGSTIVTQIAISDAGSVNANLNLSNVFLFYKEEPTCSSSTIPAGVTQFNASGASFNSSEKAIISGVMPVGANNVCLYVQLSIGSGASDDETVEIEISNPSADIVPGSGVVVPSSLVDIPGTTVIKGDMAVGSAGTQAVNLILPSVNSFLGGAFTFARSASSTHVTQITLTETATVNANLNLSNVVLFYKQEPVCSAGIPVGATAFNYAGADFNAGEKAVISGSMPVGTSNVCLYVQLDIGSGASEGQTVDIEISNPSIDVVAASGTISPQLPVAISGSSSLLILTVSTAAEGTQATSFLIPSTNNYLGGAFIFARNSGSTEITQIILTETGTVNANANLSNVILFYKEEAECSASIPGDAVQFNSAPANFDILAKATATGTMPVGPSKVCLYVQLDVGSGAAEDETIEIEISNPSLDITVSAGVVSPSAPVGILGTTTLQPALTLIASEGTQVEVLSIPSESANIGGAFTFIRNIGSANITQITITEAGDIDANANLSNIVLFYKQEAECSVSIPGDAAQFNSAPVNFDAGDKTTATGTMPVGTSKVCLYVQLDVGSGAIEDDSIEIEISNPPTDVIASEGPVRPFSAVAISGMTVASSPTFYSYGLPFVYSAANWWGNVNFYLEVYMKSITGTVQTRLYDETIGAIVANSLMVTRSASFTRLRTAYPLTLVNGHTYRIQLGKGGENVGAALGAKLIAVY